MQGQLSQKERMLLEDLKKEEDLCITKYQNYAQQAQDPQLGQLFSRLAGEEQKHYNTISQILQSGGQVQSGLQSGGQAQSGGQGSLASQMQFGQAGGKTAQPAAQFGLNKTGTAGDKDQYMAHDMLSLEKYVSSAYDTGIFESAQPHIRQVLQQIQKDEQKHGEQIFQYMSSHGMYQTQ